MENVGILLYHRICVPVFIYSGRTVFIPLCPVVTGQTGGKDRQVEKKSWLLEPELPDV